MAYAGRRLRVENTVHTKRSKTDKYGRWQSARRVESASRTGSHLFSVRVGVMTSSVTHTGHRTRSSRARACPRIPRVTACLPACESYAQVFVQSLETCIIVTMLKFKFCAESKQHSHQRRLSRLRVFLVCSDGLAVLRVQAGVWLGCCV